MQRVAETYQDISKPVNVLDLLRSIFEDMDNREYVIDIWLQGRATVPSRQAMERTFPFCLHVILISGIKTTCERSLIEEKAN